MKLIKIILLLILATTFIACMDEYSEDVLRKRCEATLCTDSLCLHWDPIIKRCGTEEGLLNEYKRISPEAYEKILQNIDSLRIMQLEQQEKHLKTKDSLLVLFSKKMKEHKDKDILLDSMLYQMKLNHFCKTVKKENSFFFWQATLIASEICK